MDQNYDAAASMPVTLASLAIAILTIVALWKIFTKAGEPGWAAIVPFYNAYVEFKIAGFNPWLFLLLFVPVVNIVMLILVALRIGKAFGKGLLWTIVLLILLPTIGYLILGFGSATYDRSRLATV